MPNEDLSFYIRTYDHNLAEPLCRQLIDSFGALPRFQKQNGRGIRAGLEGSAWTELNVTRLSDAAFLGMMRGFVDRALERYNRDIGLPIGIPNTPLLAEFVMKRYRPGQNEQFQLHFDAINFVANRYLVMMWYLNDVEAGGETEFPQLKTKIAPRAGRLLMFPPYWMYQHQGLPPASGDKYILSTYLLFDMTT
ncbi:MAG TPA: 2OG-Fe(II) oxygenase [Steroidobacteraceae bacterium]|nr:2OG-Fe(II) oxygenase [Steroidobacteraceae bacterium]